MKAQEKPVEVFKIPEKGKLGPQPDWIDPILVNERYDNYVLFYGNDFLMEACYGDWVVKDVYGRIHVYSPGHFAEKYDLVEETETEHNK